MAIKNKPEWFVGCFNRENKLIGKAVPCKDEADAIARASYADKENIEKVLNNSNHNMMIPRWVNRYYAFTKELK